VFSFLQLHVKKFNELFKHSDECYKVFLPYFTCFYDRNKSVREPISNCLAIKHERSGKVPQRIMTLNVLIMCRSKESGQRQSNNAVHENFAKNI
jgi:hypothetical protein